MMSYWHLLWIIPLSGSVAILLFAIVAGGSWGSGDSLSRSGEIWWKDDDDLNKEKDPKFISGGP